MTLNPTWKISPEDPDSISQYKVVLCKLKSQTKSNQWNILSLKKQDPPVGSFKFKYIRLLLVVYGFGCQRMMHTHGVFQILFRQGLFRFIFILQMDRWIQRKLRQDHIQISSSLFMIRKKTLKLKEKQIRKSMKAWKKWNGVKTTLCYFRYPSREFYWWWKPCHCVLSSKDTTFSSYFFLSLILSKEKSKVK